MAGSLDLELRRTFINGLLIVVGVVGLGWSALTGLDTLRLDLGQRGETVGVVRDCHLEGRFSHGSRVELQYVAPEDFSPRTVSTHFDAPCRDAAGERLRVTYLVSSPGVAMAAKDLETAPERVLLIALLSFLLLIVGLVIWRIRNRAATAPPPPLPLPPPPATSIATCPPPEPGQPHLPR